MIKKNRSSVRGKWVSYSLSIIFLTVLILPQNSFALIEKKTVLQQRELFKQAENAIAHNDKERFKRLIVSLEGYPVVAYLHYDDLKSRLNRAQKSEIKSFLDEYKDYPFAYRLRGKWLDKLAKRKQWDDYLDFYQGQKNTRHRCLSLTARIETGRQLIGINKDIALLWNTGYSQPEECDQPFNLYLSTVDNRSQVLWERIEKAFKARRPSLARYLAKKMDPEDRELVETWYRAHRKPSTVLSQLSNSEDLPINRKIIQHAVDRLARRTSLKAKDFWDEIQHKFTFTENEKDKLNKRIALSAAYQHKAESKELLEQLPDKLKSDNAHLWLARIHLRDEDWIGLIKTIIAMPEHLKKETEWEYWLARAYDQAGLSATAFSSYARLAGKSSYYGFLAADRIKTGYTITQQQASDKTAIDEPKILSKNIHLLRARELFFLERQLDARREWFQAIRKLNQEEIKQAATMASSWKWHDNAIKTVAKTSHRSDYDLRFPMPYQNLVMKNVKQNDLDPSVVYGVIRRESLFDPLAKSRVGALGLMQLMPATARKVAQSLGLKRPRQADILNIDNNIKLGTKYFKTVLNRFDKNVSLAAAAYNAGPSNVKKWLPDGESLPADQWVETVPFKETRNYIQAVLAYATIFDKHLGQKVKISSRMQDVKSSY